MAHALPHLVTFSWVLRLFVSFCTFGLDCPKISKQSFIVTVYLYYQKNNLKQDINYLFSLPTWKKTSSLLDFCGLRIDLRTKAILKSWCDFNFLLSYIFALYVLSGVSRFLASCWLAPTFLSEVPHYKKKLR